MYFLWDNAVDGVIPVLEKFEAAFSWNEFSGNPYCPEEAELKAYILTPDGKWQQIFGFWYQGFERCLRDGTEILIPSMARDWRIRYAPRMAGKHCYYVVFEDKKEQRTYRCPQEGTFSFRAKHSDRKGFLKVSDRDSAYLEFSDKSPYLGIGHNLCGWEWGGTDNREGTYEYDRWLYEMAQNGANLAQFDFCEGDQIEWTGHERELPFSGEWKGLNHYNQQNAWKMDRRFQTAEELGIFFRLTLFHWEDFDDETENFPDWGWNRNPYRKENGGPAANVSEFFRNKECRNYVKFYLKYVTARWGYSPNLMAYELWNEIDAPEVMWEDGKDYNLEASCVRSWHQEMGTYLKQLDRSHLVTTSYADSRRDPDMWQLPCMDLTTVHRYTYFNEDYGQKQYDTVGTLAAICRERSAQVKKPVLFVEFALSPGGDIQKDFDPQGIEFHTQLWASVMLKSMGTAMHWTWGSYLDKNRLYREYLPLSRFFYAEDLRETQTFGNLENDSDSVLVLGLKKTDRAWIWVKDRAFHFQSSAAQRGQKTEAGTIVSISGLNDDLYRVTFYDTAAGAEQGRCTKKAEGGILCITLPEFLGDLAVKVRQEQGVSSLESIDIPEKKNSSGTEILGHSIRLAAGGAGFCRDKEEYRFVFRKVSGDFVLQAKICSLTNLGEHASAGLMIREKLIIPEERSGEKEGFIPTGGYVAVLLHPYGKGQILKNNGSKTEILLEFDAGEQPVFCLQRKGERLLIWIAAPCAPLKTLLELRSLKTEELYAGLTASSTHTITYINAIFDEVQLIQ